MSGRVPRAERSRRTFYNLERSTSVDGRADGMREQYSFKSGHFGGVIVELASLR